MQVVYSNIDFDAVCDVLATISKEIAFSFYTNTKRLLLQGTKANIDKAKEIFNRLLNLSPDAPKNMKSKSKHTNPKRDTKPQTPLDAINDNFLKYIIA